VRHRSAILKLLNSLEIMSSSLFSMSLTMSNKRARTEMSGMDRQRMAAAIGARTNAKYPYRDYGRSYTQRGVPGSQSMIHYGPSWKEATDVQKSNRKANGYTGRGGFFADLGKWAGRGIGGLLGNKDRGGRIGGGIGTVYEKLTGKGLYEGRGLYTGRGLYDANALVTGPHLATRPQLTFSGTGDETATLIMSQKEYIGDVFGPSTSNFVSSVYDLNPGLTSNFPFLAQYAQNFEEYEFEQLVFEYHSTVDASSTNNPNGNTGTVIMATNYNVSSPAFSDKEQMIQYHGGVSGRMTDNLTHGVECDPSKNAGSAQKYIRTFIPTGQDLKTYDLGKFQLAFQNIPASYFNQQVGELWVHYKVRLTKPRLFSAQAGNVQEFRAITSGFSGGTVSAAFASGATTSLFAQGNSLSCLVSPASLVDTLFSTSTVLFGHRVTFPASANGVFEVILRYSTNSATILSGLAPAFGTSSDNNRGQIMQTQTTGNVAPWNDIYGDIDRSGGSAIGVSFPVWNQVYLHSPPEALASGQPSKGTACILIARVQVKSATAGVDNTLLLAYLANTPIFQCECTVREITPYLAISASVQRPQFVDLTGQVRIP